MKTRTKLAYLKAMVMFLYVFTPINNMAKALRIANVLLLLVAAFLLMTWVFSGSITGQVSYTMSCAEPECRFISADDFSNEIENIDLCCFEIQKMLTCEKIYDSEFDYLCYNIKEGNKYYLNSKAFNYCLKEGYDLEKAN